MLKNQPKQSKLPEGENDLIEKARSFAMEAHRGQKRMSGEPYIIHPEAVAETLTAWQLDSATIAAALLHDTVEDTGATLEQIRQEFGSTVAMLVDGVTKLDEIDFGGDKKAANDAVREAIVTENLRKLFLAMAKDIRVVLIKLADNLHNLQTLGHLPINRQKKFAKESLDIYAPLADRLGMGRLKAEIEDLAFRYYLPNDYKKLSSQVERLAKERERQVVKMKRFLSDELTKEQIQFEVDGRAKHLWSIHKKLQKEDDLSKIYDLVAIRVIVNEIEDCYRVLGVIHKHFKPLIYRIKDYIALPKPNGYQSLHTTVFGLDGQINEIQIRTRKMHREAENGVAAHFIYEGLKPGTLSVPSKKLEWVKNLLDWQSTIADSRDFTEGLKIDLFNDRIFVFSPKGDVYDLPAGATPIDFAYLVHSAIGDSCIGAKVNNKMVQLDHQLENRDVVEIITSKKASPKRDWLNFVKTASSRQHIRSFFKRLDRGENIETGRKLLNEELEKWNKPLFDKLDNAHLDALLKHYNFKTTQDLLVGIGDGTLGTGHVIRKLFSAKELGLEVKLPARKIKIDKVAASVGDKDIKLSVAKCCTPVAFDEIVGYVSRGVVIHRQNCLNVINGNPQKIIRAWWEEGQKLYAKQLHFIGSDRPGLLRDVTGVITDLGINIVHVRSKTGARYAYMDIALETFDFDSLNKLTNKLKNFPEAIEVKLI